MSKKVFCKNCEHLVMYTRSFPDCKIIKCESIEYDPVYGKTSRIYSKTYNPGEKNKEFNCSDYKRKWWLFWI